MSRDAKGENATAAGVDAGIYGNQRCESRSSAQSPWVSANGDRERGLAPIERFLREGGREEPFRGKRE